MNTDRTYYIGGSDVAGILGLSPYASPWSVWMAKTTGEQAERSDDMNERLEIGKDAEQFLATVFNRHHADAGIGVDLWQMELKDERYPWLRGHADGLVIDATTKHAEGWEAKTDRAFTPWDEVPAYYQCQAQTYMILSGLDHWWFTVGFAGWKVKHYVVAADADDQALILKATEAFWNDHVLTGIPPDADAHPATTAAIRHHYDTVDPDDILFADDDLTVTVAQLRHAKEELAAIDARVTELENRIKVRMEDCAELRDGDRVLATWKQSTTSRLDVDRFRAEQADLAAEYTKTSTSRRFLIKQPKGE